MARAFIVTIVVLELIRFISNADRVLKGSRKDIAFNHDRMVQSAIRTAIHGFLVMFGLIAFSALP